MKKETCIRRTTDFLDLLQEHFKPLSENGNTPATDYRVAKEMGWLSSGISNYRNGRSNFSDEVAVQVADVLGMEREYVLACIHFERAKSGTLRDTWRVIALGSTNALVLAVAGFAGLGGWLI